MRIPMIAGNWKMNTTVDEAIKLVKSMLGKLDKVNGIEKIICPPYISLSAISDLVKGSSVKVGAQNVFYEERGAFTGEISPIMLADLCEHVILGHSERRQYFGETCETVDKKVQAVFRINLKPIMCVGETLEENEAGSTKEVLSRQVLASSDRLYYLGGLVIAYEPIWAIGTGRSASGEEANKTITFIRQVIAHKHGSDIADNVRILYGGSVTAGNIAEFIRQPDIDGALVGGASLKADDFISIARQTSELRGLS